MKAFGLKDKKSGKLVCGVFPTVTSAYLAAGAHISKYKMVPVIVREVENKKKK
jgi:hypothetical protein